MIEQTKMRPDVIVSSSDEPSPMVTIGNGDAMLLVLPKASDVDELIGVLATHRDRAFKG